MQHQHEFAHVHTQLTERGPRWVLPGFGSQFSLVECVLSAVTDEFPGVLRNSSNSRIFRVSVNVFTFLMGLPMVTRVSE